MSRSMIMAVLKFPIEPTPKNLGWILMFMMSLFVLALVDLPYLSPHHPSRPHHWAIRWLLLPHLLAGGIALLSGPIQFSSRLRRQFPRAHRVLGRVYVGSILFAAPLAMAIPIYLHQDSFYVTGTIVHAGSWFVTTLVAFLIARNRHIAQHRQWMIRSYAVTFSFIIVRVFSKFVHLHDAAFGIADITITFLVLLVPDIGMNWRELITRRAPAHAAPPVREGAPARSGSQEFPEPVGAAQAG